jgi:4-hydroxy-tetrahydrodipicolinate reductase
MRVGIAGVGGRMGRLLVEEAASAGHELAGGIGRGGDLAVLAAGCDVIVDFTHASTVGRHAGVVAEAGVAWILGTSGLSVEDEARVAATAAVVPVVYAANFAPGVNLVLALVERMAAALPGSVYDAEILEMHHRQKLDAPSGTALALGRAVASGRGVQLEAVMESGRHGASGSSETGARADGAIGFAALRGGQVVGEHSVMFAAAAEHITISHRAFDRRAYASGAIRAAEWTGGRAPGLYSMMSVLGVK